MKKKIIIIIIGILILFVGIKLYHFFILSKCLNSVNEYIQNDIGGYYIEISNGDNNIIKYTYYDKEKSITTFNNIIEYRNFLTDETYIINDLEKTYKKFDLVSQANKIDNLPSILMRLFDGKWDAIFSAIIIRPIKYEGRNAYKVFTFDEEWIIDGESYLPVYCVKNIYRDDKKIDKMKSKVTYVTNLEEIYIENPDLSEYTEVK